MGGIRDVLRDAPAGQLARLYLGLKISPYVDEQEGFGVPKQPSGPSPGSPAERAPERDSTQDNGNDAFDKDTSEQSSEKDLERNAADQPSSPPHVEPKSDTGAVVWSGPTDADNPQNWSTMKKTFVFAQICLLTFASQSAPSTKGFRS
jgi:DHA1 family multidrug resistance protein-like MFS transporter